MKLKPLVHTLPLAAAGLSAAPALAADLDVSVQIPALDVAEYHRPYVAVWLEREDRSVARQLALWYQLKRGGAPAGAAPMGGAPGPAAGGQGGAEGGTKWLPDLRQWWRRGGRELSVPADGITGATRPVGEHALSFAAGKAPLGDLAPGRYKLVVEAAREDGGRELVDLAFDWPGTAPQALQVQGKSELGLVKLAVKP